jgi:VWFA-related protein
MRVRAVIMRTAFIFFNMLMLTLFPGVSGQALARTTRVSLAPQASGQLNVHLQQLIPQGYNQLIAYVSVLDAAGHPVAGLTANQVSVVIDTQSPVQPQDLTEVTDVSEPITAAILLDTSTTMGYDDKLPAAKAAIKAFGQSLNAQDQVAFYQLAGTGPAGVKRLLNFTTDHAKLNTVVDPLQAGAPGTRAPIYDGLYQVAKDMAPLSGRKLIVLQTDQHDDGSVHTLAQALDLVKSVHLPVYTIGLGADADQSTLQEISQATGGASFANPDSTGLAGSYQSILSQLRDLYRLTVQVPTAFSVGVHHVQVQVDYQSTIYKDPPDPIDLNDANGPGVFVVPATNLSLHFSLKSGAQVSGTTNLAVDVLGDDLPISSVSVTINGKPYATLKGNGPHFQLPTWNTRYLLPGAYKIHITATDIEKNTASLDLTVQVGIEWPYWIISLVEAVLIILALIVLRYASFRYMGGRLEGILTVRNPQDQKAEVELGEDVRGSRMNLKITEEGIVIGPYPPRKKFRFEGPAKPIPETTKVTKKGRTVRIRLYVKKERMEAGGRRIPVPYYHQRGKKKAAELKGGMSKRAGNYRVDFSD